MFAALLVSHRRFTFLPCLLVLGLLLASSSLPVLAQFDFGGLGGRGDSDEKVTVESQFAPATADRPALLFVTATISDNFHISAIDQGALPNDGGGPLPTTISISPEFGVELLGEWQSIEKPTTHIDQEIWTGLELREHYQQVTWFASISLPANRDSADLSITGKLNGLACNTSCIPFELTFAAKQDSGVALPPGIEIKTTRTQAPPKPTVDSTAQQTPPQQTSPQQTTPQQTTPSPTTPQQVATLPVGAHLYDLSQVSLSTTTSRSFGYYLLAAFLGGLILNVMPCVLPVIGLKVMSFVQQAGQSRAHAFALNLWYSAGIIAVFLVLAGLAKVFDLGWGEQMSSSGFNIALIGIVFAMALSLLGLWDIPIPGFVGSNAAVEITEREGPTAAFLKGILTTLLATPCTGPFMATALVWAVKQPGWVTFSVFAMLGIGMASPYLVIGAFPSLIRFLPKPGMWMEKFKVIMGFVLLATVVWLMTTIDISLAVPTVAMLVGVAIACWLIAQTPITAPTEQKAYGWITAMMLVTISIMFSYGWLYRDVMKPRYEKRLAQAAEQKIGEQRLRIARDLSQIRDPNQLRDFVAALAVESLSSTDENWQHFSLSKLGQLTLGQGRTVLVDFTADWCASCKVLERTVLKTADVEEAITAANVITLEADYTKKPESIKRTIKALGSTGIPLIAIFPANDPYHPIVFSNGVYTKNGIIQGIAQATGRKDLLQGKAGSSAALSQTPDQESRR